MKLNTNMIVPRHKIGNGKYISPTPYIMMSSDLQETAPTGFSHFSDVSPINSGILVSVESFIRSGGYEEDVWLDFQIYVLLKNIRKYIRPTIFYLM